jgi:hypothetical protein
MTTTDISYRSSLNKVSNSNEKIGISCKISIFDRPILSLTLDKRQKGGQGLGKQRRIKGFYIDSENRVYAEYAVKHDDEVNGSGSFYQYAIIGRLHLLREETV